MRAELSRLICETASGDDRFIVLSGDHGYALFDGIRKQSPKQFVNVGVMEQAMVGMAGGLIQEGFYPLVYGLAAFVPTRVLEQIKLDICHTNRKVIFIGDGAGLVYSTLGSSHHCGEDLASLRALPNMKVYTPGDAVELKVCFNEARSSSGPSYIRIGKSDRPRVANGDRTSTLPLVSEFGISKKACIVSIGSMSGISAEISKELGVTHISISRIKPIHRELLDVIPSFQKIIAIEEHYPSGGLVSALMELFVDSGQRAPLISQIALKEKFADRCGSYQYALSEHDMSDAQLRIRIKNLLG